jgi:hypothetical protein
MYKGFVWVAVPILLDVLISYRNISNTGSKSRLKTNQCQLTQLDQTYRHEVYKRRSPGFGVDIVLLCQSVRLAYSWQTWPTTKSAREVEWSAVKFSTVHCEPFHYCKRFFTRSLLSKNPHCKYAALRRCWINSPEFASLFKRLGFCLFLHVPSAKLVDRLYISP